MLCVDLVVVVVVVPVISPAAVGWLSFHIVVVD